MLPESVVFVYYFDVLILCCRAESTRDTYNYGQYINQFPPNTIKVIREFERIQKRICRHKMSVMFNEICINEEMLPKYTYIHIYIVLFGLVQPELGVIPSGQDLPPLHPTCLFWFIYPLDLKKSCFIFLRVFGSH